ncbi:MAG: DUF5672 family protein [Myxococcota bacterium]
MSLRLALPQVTLVAVTSVNVAATIKALGASMAQVEFGACRLLSDAPPIAMPEGIEHIPIARLASASAYSDFMLHHLADYIETSHCLVVQWDGHVLDSARWLPEFLEYDYIGASWPQFTDGHEVGNGGFSLRSQRLLDACRAPDFRPSHPEDLAIGRENRKWLETRGLKFASKALADAFSTERTGNLADSFGYHGVWHMPHILGREAFWTIYRGLDERTSVRHDFGSVLCQIAGGKGGIRRAIDLVTDQIRGMAMLGKAHAARRKVS